MRRREISLFSAATQCHRSEKFMRRRDFFSFIGGAMVAMPGIARAQPAGKIPTVGYLWHAGNAKEETPYFEALLEGFAKLGYVEGRNRSEERRVGKECRSRWS